MSAPAIRGVYTALTQTNEYMKELIKEFKNRMRPRVIVQIRPSRTSINILNLEIKNVGNTTAYDISCRFTPDIKYENTDLALSQLPIFNKLSLLAPREEIQFFFANAIEYLTDQSRPIELESVISYRDDSGEKYEDKISIKINQLEKLRFIEEKGLNDVADGLRRVERILDKIEYVLRQRR